MHFSLEDRRLWGNEAADDEDPGVLNSYFVTQPEWHEFFSTAHWPLSIARAKKGMGKSALLAESAFRLRNERNSLVISIKGSDLVAQREFKNLTASEQIYDWQQRICAVINRTIGSQIGFAFSDDSMAMVEAAELSGFKRRNLVGALVDRLKGKLGPVELQKLAAVDSKALLTRKVLAEDQTICILIDDIDATYTDTPTENIRLSTYFTACRELTSDHRGIAIRTVVRSDVWASIRKSDEALDKVEQYIFEIHWGQSAFRKFLIERIVSYCDRFNLGHLTRGKSKEQILEIVFSPRFPWGAGLAPPERIIQVFSGGRPRWAAQLCRMAGAAAMKKPTSRVITFGNIKEVMDAYGRHRIDDLTREHRHQCSTVQEIVNTFGAGSTTYTTQQLLDLLESRVLPNIEVVIDGVKVSDPISVARFLFRIGFLMAKEQRDPTLALEYFQYQDKPELLRNRSNLDNGLKWFIHPSLHGALGLEYIGSN